MSGTITINSTDLANAIKPQLLQMPEISIQPYSYIIFTDGTNYYAKNGKTGQIDFSGTDAGTVIQSAINALSGKGGTIFLKAGIYVLTQQLDLSNSPGIKLVGEYGTYHEKGTILRPVSGVRAIYAHTSDPFWSEITIENIGIYGQETLPSGVQGEIYIWSGGRVHLRNIYIRNARNVGIKLESVTVGFIENVEIVDGVSGSGISILFGEVYVDNVVIGNLPGAGINIYNTDYVRLTNIREYVCNTGISINTDRGPVDIIGATFDNNYKNGIWIWNLSYGGTFVDVKARNNNFNNQYTEKDGAGMYMRLATGLQVIGGDFSDNRSTPYQTYGIYEDGNDYNVIINARIVGNTVAPVKLTGTHSKVIYTQGYVTQNSGKATFSGDGATTQFKIPHSLALTPSKVLVTPGSNDAKDTFYVTADATYIYVNYATAPPPGTNNVVLYWYAEV
jgi:hypothetical protein